MSMTRLILIMYSIGEGYMAHYYVSLAYQTMFLWVMIVYFCFCEDPLEFDGHSI